MSNRYPTTLHITGDMVGKIDQPVDPALISNRPGGGNTTQSFIKGDIIADALNEVFGPLGWSVQAKIHQMDDWDESKSVSRGGGRQDVNVHMVQVVSDVTLTIKKVTADGTDTVFSQPGIGSGEAEAGKSRKEAFGMAVKGAATDGLKRCATLVGKRFGMMMASNGSQEDVEYAHNGKAQNLQKARAMRRGAQGGGSGGGREDGRRDERDRRDERPSDARREQQREEPRREAPRDQASRDQPRRDEARDGDRGRQAERPRDEDQGGGRGASGGDASGGRVQKEGGAQAAAKDAHAAGASAAADKAEAPKAAARRQADTDYPLDNLPITLADMTNFGATLIARVGEMRQASDRTGLVRKHLNTVKNLDAKIRKRVIERLRELGVDVDQIPS